MGSGKVFSEDGIVFLYLHGTVAFQIPDDELSRRLSLAIAITERRGYLLTWFFAAPHDAELQGLTNERALFDKTVNVASAGKPAPAETQPPASDPASFNATQTVQSADPASPASSAAVPSTTPSDKSANSSGSATSTPETADQQQSSSERFEFRLHPFAVASWRNHAKPARQRRCHQTEINSSAGAATIPR